MVLKNNAVSWEDHRYITYKLWFAPFSHIFLSCISPDVSHHPVAPVCQADTASSAPTTTTTTTTTTASTTTTMSCPSGWSEFQGGCYKFYGSSTETWHLADATCLTEGARLTSVHSVEEESFLNDLANGNSYWIGGYPKGISTWVWSDFTSFDFDNDYSTSSDQCLVQSSSHYGSGWSSSYCSSSSYEYYFICKQML